MHTIFDPNTVPVTGLFTYPHPSALKDGEFQQLQNVRWDDRSIRVRPGIAQEQTTVADTISGGAVNAGVHYGGIIVRRNGSGDFVHFEALEISGSPGTVGIFHNTWNGTIWGGWTEFTTSANRLVTPTHGYVQFVSVPNGSGGTEFVVAQDGSSSPMVLSSLGTNNSSASVAKVKPPIHAKAVAPVLQPSATLDVANASGNARTITSSGTGIVFTQDGSAGSNTWLLTANGASTPVGDTSEIIEATTSSDASNGEQVMFLCEASDDTFYTCCKWYLVNADSDDILIHDPQNLRDSRIQVNTTQSGVKMQVFSYGENASAKGSGEIDDIKGIKLEITNADLTFNATLKIRGVMFGGVVPGMAQYAATFYNPFTFTESAGVVMRIGEAANSTTNVRGKATDRMSVTSGALEALPPSRSKSGIYSKFTVDADWTIPIDSRVLYSFSPPVFAPLETEGAANVTTYRLYRKDPGERDFYHIGDTTTNTTTQTTSALFDGDSEAATSTEAWEMKADSDAFTDTTAPEDKDFELRLPDAFNEQMPIGRTMLNANQRLYVGGRRGTGGNRANAAVFKSETDQPMRFRLVPRFVDGSLDSDSGQMYALHDGEVMTLRAGSASLVGVRGVYCWTDNQVYKINDFTAEPIAELGTIAAGSVAHDRGTFYWVDQDLVVRSMDSSIRDLSRYRIHDQLTDVPAARRQFMSAAMYEGRYYLSHATSSSNENHKVLVYNTDLDVWESHDSVPTTIPVSQFFKWTYSNDANNESASRLMFYRLDGQLWEYEKDGTADDGGTTIALEVRTGQYTNEWERIRVGQAEIVCDDQDDRTMTVLRTSLKPTGTKSGTLSLDQDTSDTKVWRKDVKSGKGRPMISGVAIDVKFTVSVQHPFVINALKIEAETGQGEGADAE